MNSQIKTRKDGESRLIKSFSTTIAIALIFSMLIGPKQKVRAANPFTDVSTSDWFYAAVDYVYNQGYMAGVGNNLFDPNGNTTNAQVASVLFKICGEPGRSTTEPYSDVSTADWFYNPVLWANNADNNCNNDIAELLQTNTSTFSPNSTVTRVKLAQVMWKFAQIRQNVNSSAPSNSVPFTDVSGLTTDQLNAVKWCYANGIMNGTSGTAFSPNSTVTRAALAATVKNYGGNLQGLQFWWLADTGKHLDWDGSTTYQTQFNAAVVVWNNYKSGVIRPDDIIIIQDVVISDDPQTSSVAGLTSSSGSIVFNPTVMGALTTAQQENVCIHELGHALGLAHNGSSDIMFEFLTPLITLSNKDQHCYDVMYNKY